MKFNWEGFKNGKIAVHCDTEEKAKDFVKKCYKYGIKWLCEANDDATFWEKYENDTFYFGGFNLHMANISILSYGNYADVEDEIVFEWELTPFYPELKEGMIIECRNGDRYLLRNVRGDLILSANKGWVEYVYDNNFIDIGEDAKAFNGDYDIMKIYESKAYVLEDLFDDNYLECIWERKEPKKMTLEQISKALGYEVEGIDNE